MSKLRNIIREEIFDFEKFIKNVPFKLERPWVLYLDKNKSVNHQKFLNAQKLMFKLGYTWFDGDEGLDYDYESPIIGLMQPDIFLPYSHMNHDGDWFIVITEVDNLTSFAPNNIDEYNIYYLEDIEKMVLKESSDFNHIKD